MSDWHEVDREIADIILKADIALIEKHPASERALGLMIAEHGARVQTLSRLIDPAVARPLLMMVASALVAEAKSLEEKG